jgi:hypothetical protein
MPTASQSCNDQHLSTIYPLVRVKETSMKEGVLYDQKTNHANEK